MTEGKKPSAPPAPSPIEPSHLILLEDADRWLKGQIVPNTPETIERLAGKTRPATPSDLGVAGIMTREA